jgi:Na+(H+)/acetate symporter ActP
LAVAKCEVYFSAFFVALVQGYVFIATLVASQFLARGSRSTVGDLLQSRVTKAEVGAVACTGAKALLVLVVMGSLKG